MRNVQKSAGFTLQLWKGESESPEWLHCLREPEFKNHVFSPEEWGIFFRFPPAPQSFAGFPLNWVLLYDLNI